MQIHLLTAEDCTLCDKAKTLLYQIQTSLDLRFKEVDIREDRLLFNQYRYVIPVVKSLRGEELRWPFDEAELRAFVLLHCRE